MSSICATWPLCRTPLFPGARRLAVISLIAPPLSCRRRPAPHVKRAVKRVPCHVLETRMPHVMDGRVVSRGLCFTLNNLDPQPSCFAMDIAASPVHAS
jgi:hypothetical protein